MAFDYEGRGIPAALPLLARQHARLLLLLVLGSVAAATVAAAPTLVDSRGRALPPAPAVPVGELSEQTRADIDLLIKGLRTRRIDTKLIGALGNSEDARVLWVLIDLMRFAGYREMTALMAAFEEATGHALPGNHLNEMPDRLIAWDIPAPPGYREMKAGIFTQIEPSWKPFFADEHSAIDWRMVFWGGVLIDDRVDAGPGRRCFRCIPALDDPPVTAAAGGDWYPDERLVFGVVINDEARAYPKNIMEVHEMVNDTLGGRRFGMPYCTLCGSAQAYFTDDLKGFSAGAAHVRAAVSFPTS